MTTKLVWVDLETTGLDPQRDHILEIAIATSTLEDPFNLTHVFHRVFGAGSRALKRMDAFVTEMHTKNGLLAEVAQQPNLAKGLIWHHCERELIDLLMPANGDPKPILAGSTVHFDRAFLKNYWPGLEGLFSHRHYDVSSIKLFCQSLGMATIAKGEAHRAKDDIIESAAHARLCMDWLNIFFTAKAHFEGVR